MSLLNKNVTFEQKTHFLNKSRFFLKKNLTDCTKVPAVSLQSKVIFCYEFNYKNDMFSKK